MSKVGELTQKILNLLPGVDCGGMGGCGYNSCSACALAIAEGGVVNLCPACGTEAVKAIADAAGRLPVEVEEKIAFIRCAGNAAGKERFINISSCEEAKKNGVLDSECKWGCFGAGSCIKVCKFDAMRIESGSIIIDRDKCSGCMACIDMCPQRIIEMIPKDATNFIPCSSKDNEKKTLTTCGYGCIGCGDCEEVCPEGAVKVIDNCAVIDYEKCAGCVACTVKCRKKIVVDKLHDLSKLKEDVAFVRCTGGAEADKKFKALGIENCEDTLNLDLKSMGLCSYGCTGLGNCLKVCRYDAVDVRDGYARIDYEKCVGCGDCARECPKNIIDMVPYMGVKHVACSSEDSMHERISLCSKGCIGCGDCADNCPCGAISMERGYPVVNPMMCENCGVCTYVCSRDVIKVKIVPEYNYMQMDAMKIDDIKDKNERKWE
ncbi:MAG: 4Fe-4S binding protein [Anaerovoracaceae bacterium]